MLFIEVFLLLSSIDAILTQLGKSVDEWTRISETFTTTIKIRRPLTKLVDETVDEWTSG